MMSLTSQQPVCEVGTCELAQERELGMRQPLLGVRFPSKSIIYTFRHQYSNERRFKRGKAAAVDGCGMGWG